MKKANKELLKSLGIGLAGGLVVKGLTSKTEPTKINTLVPKTDTSDVEKAVKAYIAKPDVQTLLKGETGDTGATGLQGSNGFYNFGGTIYDFNSDVISNKSIDLSTDTVPVNILTATGSTTGFYGSKKIPVRTDRLYCLEFDFKRDNTNYTYIALRCYDKNGNTITWLTGYDNQETVFTAKKLFFGNSLTNGNFKIPNGTNSISLVIVAYGTTTVSIKNFCMREIPLNEPVPHSLLATVSNVLTGLTPMQFVHNSATNQIGIWNGTAISYFN